MNAVRLMRPAVVLTSAALLLTVAAGRLPAQAGGAEAKRALARDLVTLLAVDSAVIRAIEGAVPLQRAANPRIPQVFWDRFLNRARQNLSVLTDSVVQLYADRFSQRDLQDLVTFYRTPLGQRLRAELPALQLATQELGSRWGARIGAEVGQELAGEGIVIEP